MNTANVKSNAPVRNFLAARVRFLLPSGDIRDILRKLWLAMVSALPALPVSPSCLWPFSGT